MKRSVYLLTRSGSFRRLHRLEQELSPPGAHEVTVEVRGIGLNFADVFTILGLYKAAPKRNCIPGIEFSGEVAALGRGVTGFHIGDRVIGSIRFGAYVTHLNIDPQYLIPLPAGWTSAEGAAFIVQALTAYYALLRLGNLQQGQTVLIHSAAGGVGLYANRIAKRFGAFTIGTVGGPAKVPLVHAEGYDRVIVRGRRFDLQLRDALGGRPLDLVLDAVGGSVQRASFDALATTGRMVAYGLSEFASHRATPDYVRLALRFLRMPRYSTLRLIESNRSILSFNLIWLYDRVDELRGMLEEIAELQLPRPIVGGTFPFERLREAVQRFQSGGTTGKIVVLSGGGESEG
jgi:NADPH:quinone reductase-like Zn-dependent oxidoreductase